jgi:hypothetical protein
MMIAKPVIAPFDTIGFIQRWGIAAKKILFDVEARTRRRSRPIPSTTRYEQIKDRTKNGNSRSLDMVWLAEVSIHSICFYFGSENIYLHFNT